MASMQRDPITSTSSRCLRTPCPRSAPGPWQALRNIASYSPVPRPRDGSRAPAAISRAPVRQLSLSPQAVVQFRLLQAQPSAPSGSLPVRLPLRSAPSLLGCPPLLRPARAYALRWVPDGARSSSRACAARALPGGEPGSKEPTHPHPLALRFPAAARLQPGMRASLPVPFPGPGQRFRWRVGAEAAHRGAVRARAPAANPAATAGAPAAGG